ncbi:MAG: DUF4065 domain-containing protein [Treponema sp.]|jgi:uncharacterized phage-associated protein|nr:DUF4065 domain-containing protein [Treponema sp.]
MPSVIDVATYILELSKLDSEDGEYELISPMKLQKLAYFCQGFHLALYGAPLFPEAIEAWTHGPVCPRLYHALKVYGASPIAAIIDPDKINLDEREKNLIGMVYESYGQYSAAKLRQMTHKEGPWNSTWEGSQIPKDAMIRYFKSLLIVKAEDIPPSAPEEKKEILSILREAQTNGEINLAEFSEPVGSAANR